MHIEFQKGFNVQCIDMFLMGSMKNVRVTLAVYKTDAGIVVRKNDIPVVAVDGDKTQEILVGGFKSKEGNNEQTLYRLPCFQDNATENDVGFTILEPSVVTRDHVLTLFEKL